MGGIKDKVAIIGTGCTKFGENFEMSWTDMAIDAAYEAFEDAKVDPSQVQAAWLGTAAPHYEWGQGDAGTSLADALGIYDIPITRVGNYCATGMDALRNACFAVAAEMYDMVLVVGCEKMRDVAPRDSLVADAVLARHPFFTKGRTAPGGYALSATRYFHLYGVGREVLGKVAIKNHHNGSLHPKAHFQREIDLDTYLRAPFLAEPFTVYDCCPTTDGSAAAIITTPEIAKSYGHDYVLVKGLGLSCPAGWFIYYTQDFDFVSFRATQEAAKQAYEQAGIKDPRKELDFAEVHDCFTITEIINYEDLGFCARGEGWRFISEGICTIEGEFPVNPSGGLKSFGHPIGATGMRMIYEVTRQLQGRALGAQVRNAKMGLAHNLGGPSIQGSVTILGLP